MCFLRNFCKRKFCLCLANPVHFHFWTNQGERLQKCQSNRLSNCLFSCCFGFLTVLFKEEFEIRQQATVFQEMCILWFFQLKQTKQEWKIENFFEQVRSTWGFSEKTICFWSLWFIFTCIFMCLFEEQAFETQKKQYFFSIPLKVV